jgi:hypothetical protein
LNSDVIKRFNPSRKAATLLTCGAILIGATLNFGVGSVIPGMVLHDEVEWQTSLNEDTTSNRKEFNARLDSDKKFTQIESQLVSPYDHELDAEGYGYVSEAQTQAASYPLHELYPLVPGWSSYMETLKTSDELGAESSAASNRAMLWIEFNETCKMVADLEAGFDVSKARVIGMLEDGTEDYTYKGTYMSGAGVTPDNFETFLKGCGDEKLRYLPDLKAEHKLELDERKAADQLMNQGLENTESETEQK